MSKDKIRPLIKAVADLPEHHAGLVLGIVKALSGPNQAAAAWALQQEVALLSYAEVKPASITL